MKKRYYIAAMFALGLVAQPATLRASAADEANSNKNNASAVC